MKKQVLPFMLIVLFSYLSCDDIIEVTDISNEAIVLLAPSNAVTIESNSISFDWNSLEDAESYRIQIATPSFDEAVQIVSDSLITSTSFQTTLEDNNYQWRVRAENSEYQTAYTTQSFVVQQ